MKNAHGIKRRVTPEMSRDKIAAIARQIKSERKEKSK
jgi:hypothetical protein